MFFQSHTLNLLHINLARWIETHGYIKEGNSYYKVHPKRTFDEAVQDCLDQGAELITLKTEDDYEIVRKAQLYRDTWVGKSYIYFSVMKY